TDSAAVAIAIGREVGLGGHRLRRLAVGALLHDVGMLLLDRSWLERPGRLEPAETARLRQHPSLGYELLRQLGSVAPSAGLIARARWSPPTGCCRRREGQAMNGQKIDRRLFLGSVVLALALVGSEVVLFANGVWRSAQHAREGIAQTRQALAPPPSQEPAAEAG